MPVPESAPMTLERDPCLVRGAVARVRIDELRAADSPRTAGQNADHVKALAESRSPLLPIVVHRATMRVVDGMHRLAAARLRGEQEVDIVFVACAEKDLFVHAVQLNIEHGLTLTLTERKDAAVRILHSHPHWSDRRVASVTGLSPSTVGSVRSRSTDRNGHSNTRQGRDGVERPLNADDGRRRACELLIQRPEASVREIASMAGIAPSTVHDVRRRLRDGEEPVPARRRATGASRGQPVTAAPAVRPCRATEISVGAICADPVLRHTTDGRTLLRLLSLQDVLLMHIPRLSGIVPEHLRSAVAQLARRAGDSWYELSRRLGSAQPSSCSKVAG